MKLFIAHPSGRGINPYTHNSLLYNLWELGYNRIPIVDPRSYDEYPLSRARNNIVEDLKKTDCTHVVMYDDDQIFPKGTLLRLLASRKPIASGWYLSRKGHGGLVVFSRHENKELGNPNDFNMYKPIGIRELISKPSEVTEAGTLVTVDGIGLGCIIIERSVFEKIEYPWFAEWTPLLQRDSHAFGEDLWFSERCALFGVDITVNLKCFVGHWASQGGVIGSEHLRRRALDEGLMPEDLSAIE